VVTEGRGRLVDPADTVYYKHETRFDNGQLVDLSETRKVQDKFLMSDTRYHDFLRTAFLTMKKGEIAWIKLNETQHRNMYHQANLQYQRTQEEKDAMTAAVGPTIYIKVTLLSIKRDPKCEQTASWEKKVKYFEAVREISKELISEEKEYSNAKQLYSRCVSIFKNMSKAQKESLDAEQKLQRLEILNVLFTNMSLCFLKKGMYTDCIKHGQEALGYEKKNPKAHYRMALAYKELQDLDRAKENLIAAIKFEP